MWKKIRNILLVVALVVVGVQSGGFGGVIGWFALVYVLWRAAPGIWRDIRGLHAGIGFSGLIRRRGVRANTTL